MRKIQTGLRKFGICLVVLLASSQMALGQTCPQPKVMNFQVQGEIQRDIRGFTQGLEVYGGKLFESTGAIAGNTRLTTIDPKGKVTVKADFGKMFFGEGLTILHDQIFQLSWQEHAVFVYDLNGKRLRRMNNPREGWGLTNDGMNLIFSDGSDRLFTVNPANFNALRSVQVRAANEPIAALNELENVDGKIYSNVFTTWKIIRIEPKTGCVEAVADLGALRNRMSAEEQAYLDTDSNFVLNGIAYDNATKIFYVTGKNWRTIFTGRFQDAK